MSAPAGRGRQRGVSLLEILVTLVVMAFGLLGLAALQVRLNAAEMEAYQRSHALMLLNDMASRIATNRNFAAGYVTGATYGTGMNCGTAGTNTVERDLGEWCLALQGAGETTDGGATRRGGVLGGRGCVERVGQDYLVSVAWQGLTPVAAPPAGIGCGANLYDDARQCLADSCRRVVSTLVRIAVL